MGGRSPGRPGIHADNLLNAQSGVAETGADADAFEPAYETNAELGGKLREAFLSYGRERMGDEEASLEEVLSHMGAFPRLEDGTLSRQLAKAAGLYGGDEGETDVSPAQTEYLRAQMLLALTDKVDWAAELGTHAAEGQEVTCDGAVLQGANRMTVAQAAKAVRDRISGVLQEKLNWAVPLADALVPVLAGDPTLSLPEPPETILYGSLAWAQLRIGMEYAEGVGLDPARHSVDELVALGRAATSTAPAADGGDAQSAAAQGGEASGGEAERDEASTAASYRATELLILIARARGAIDGASITEENQADLKKTLADVAHDVFKEEFAIAEALEALGRHAVSSRQDLVRQILRDHGLNPDQVVDYLGPFGQVVQRPTLAEAYFQHGNLYNILGFTPPSDLPDPATAFDEAFEKSRDGVSQAMATLIDQSLALYAKQHGLNLEGATIAISRPRLDTWQYFDWDGLPSGETRSIPSDKTILITATFPDSATARHFFLSLAEPGKGLQDIPAGTSLEEWEKANSYNLFDANPLADGYDGNGAYVGNNCNYRIEEIAGGTAAEIKGALIDFYKSEIEKSRDHLCGETTDESFGNFLLNLVPFRAMIVAIQKGDVANAVVNGFFDILSFIPFVGEGIQAVKAGARLVSTGISTFVKSALEDGLSVGLSAGLHAAEPFGHASGRQLLKTTVTGIESALPIPTPSLASHITVAGANDIARVAGRLKATLPELANTLEAAARRSRLVEIGLDGEQTLAPGVRVTEDAKGMATIDITSPGAALDKIELTLGRNDGDEIVFLKEHYNKEGKRFYTLADPRTGQSYGMRLAAETLSPVTAASLSPELSPLKKLVKIIFLNH